MKNVTRVNINALFVYTCDWRINIIDVNFIYDNSRLISGV
jgi:hypothetical protein